MGNLKSVVEWEKRGERVTSNYVTSSAVCTCVDFRSRIE